MRRALYPPERCPGVGSEGLAPFLFELASDERLDILAAVADKPLRHAQLSRRLSMTASETTRHLNRLSSADLVARDPEGAYAPTNLARLVLAQLPFLRFLTANREHILTHNLQVLPPEFVERLGALEGGEFVVGAYKVVAVQEQSLRDVEGRIWVLTEQAFEQAIPILREKAAAGADVRVIRPRKGFEDTFALVAGLTRNYPVRLLEETKFFVAVLDDIAGVCFPTPDGKTDMSAMLVLEDARGYQWSADLFLHFWERAREPLG